LTVEVAADLRVRSVFLERHAAAVAAEQREQNAKETAALQAEHRVLASHLAGMVASLEREARISADERFLMGFDAGGAFAGTPRQALLVVLHDLGSDLESDPFVKVPGLAFRIANIGGRGVCTPVLTTDPPELATVRVIAAEVPPKDDEATPPESPAPEPVTVPTEPEPVSAARRARWAPRL
jgi:hypothetical protein